MYKTNVRIPLWYANICFVGTRSGNRTRTAVAGHRILSPACLPIPPSEQPSIVYYCECKSINFILKMQTIVLFASLSLTLLKIIVNIAPNITQISYENFC